MADDAGQFAAFLRARSRRRQTTASRALVTLRAEPGLADGGR